MKQALQTAEILAQTEEFNLVLQQLNGDIVSLCKKMNNTVSESEFEQYVQNHHLGQDNTFKRSTPQESEVSLRELYSSLLHLEKAVQRKLVARKSISINVLKSNEHPSTNLDYRFSLDSVQSGEAQDLRNKLESMYGNLRNFEQTIKLQNAEGVQNELSQRNNPMSIYSASARSSQTSFMQSAVGTSQQGKGEADRQKISSFVDNLNKLQNMMQAPGQQPHWQELSINNSEGSVAASGWDNSDVTGHINDPDSKLKMEGVINRFQNFNNTINNPLGTAHDLPMSVKASSNGSNSLWTHTNEPADNANDQQKLDQFMQSVQQLKSTIIHKSELGQQLPESVRGSAQVSSHWSDSQLAPGEEDDKKKVEVFKQSIFNLKNLINEQDNLGKRSSIKSMLSMAPSELGHKTDLSFLQTVYEEDPINNTEQRAKISSFIEDVERLKQKLDFNKVAEKRSSIKSIHSMHPSEQMGQHVNFESTLRQGDGNFRSGDVHNPTTSFNPRYQSEYQNQPHNAEVYSEESVPNQKNIQTFSNVGQNRQQSQDFVPNNSALLLHAPIIEAPDSSFVTELSVNEFSENENKTMKQIVDKMYVSMSKLNNLMATTNKRMSIAPSQFPDFSAPSQLDINIMHPPTKIVSATPDQSFDFTKPPQILGSPEPYSSTKRGLKLDYDQINVSRDLSHSPNKKSDQKIKPSSTKHGKSIEYREGAYAKSEREHMSVEGDNDPEDTRSIDEVVNHRTAQNPNIFPPSHFMPPNAEEEGQERSVFSGQTPNYFYNLRKDPDTQENNKATPSFGPLAVPQVRKSVTDVRSINGTEFSRHFGTIKRTSVVEVHNPETSKAFIVHPGPGSKQEEDKSVKVTETVNNKVVQEETPEGLLVTTEEKIVTVIKTTTVVRKSLTQIEVAQHSPPMVLSTPANKPHLELDHIKNSDVRLDGPKLVNQIGTQQQPSESQHQNSVLTSRTLEGQVSENNPIMRPAQAQSVLANGQPIGPKETQSDSATQKDNSQTPQQPNNTTVIDGELEQLGKQEFNDAPAIEYVFEGGFNNSEPPQSQFREREHYDNDFIAQSHNQAINTPESQVNFQESATEVDQVKQFQPNKSREGQDYNINEMQDTQQGKFQSQAQSMLYATISSNSHDHQSGYESAISNTAGDHPGRLKPIILQANPPDMPEPQEMFGATQDMIDHDYIKQANQEKQHKEMNLISQNDQNPLKHPNTIAGHGVLDSRDAEPEAAISPTHNYQGKFYDSSAVPIYPAFVDHRQENKASFDVLSTNLVKPYSEERISNLSISPEEAHTLLEEHRQENKPIPTTPNIIEDPVISQNNFIVSPTHQIIDSKIDHYRFEPSSLSKIHAPIQNYTDQSKPIIQSPVNDQIEQEEIPFHPAKPRAIVQVPISNPSIQQIPSQKEKAYRDPGIVEGGQVKYDGPVRFMGPEGCVTKVGPNQGGFNPFLSSSSIPLDIGRSGINASPYQDNQTPLYQQANNNYGNPSSVQIQPSINQSLEHKQPQYFPSNQSLNYQGPGQYNYPNHDQTEMIKVKERVLYNQQPFQEEEQDMIKIKERVLYNQQITPSSNNKNEQEQPDMIKIKERVLYNQVIHSNENQPALHFQPKEIIYAENKPLAASSFTPDISNITPNNQSLAGLRVARFKRYQPIVKELDLSMIKHPETRKYVQEEKSRATQAVNPLVTGNISTSSNKFTDNEFHPNFYSIVDNVKDIELSAEKRFEWRRCRYVHRPIKPSVWFEEGTQGRTWPMEVRMASSPSLARVMEVLIQIFDLQSIYITGDLIRGFHSIALYEDSGERVQVNIDDFIPVTVNRDMATPAYLAPIIMGDRYFFLHCLIEKALAKMFGSYVLLHKAPLLSILSTLFGNRVKLLSLDSRVEEGTFREVMPSGDGIIYFLQQRQNHEDPKAPVLVKRNGDLFFFENDPVQQYTLEQLSQSFSAILYCPTLQDRSAESVPIQLTPAICGLSFVLDAYTDVLLHLRISSSKSDKSYNSLIHIEVYKDQDFSSVFLCSLQSTSLGSISLFRLPPGTYHVHLKFAIFEVLAFVTGLQQKKVSYRILGVRDLAASKLEAVRVSPFQNMALPSLTEMTIEEAIQPGLLWHSFKVFNHLKLMGAKICVSGLDKCEEWMVEVNGINASPHIERNLLTLTGTGEEWVRFYANRSAARPENIKLSPSQSPWAN